MTPRDRRDLRPYGRDGRQHAAMTERLGRLLLITLEAARLRADVHPLPALRSWLDSWRGLGAVERGMERQGFDLQLTRYDERGWRATFYTTGMEHSRGCARSPYPRARGFVGAHENKSASGQSRGAPEGTWYGPLYLFLL